MSFCGSCRSLQPASGQIQENTTASPLPKVACACLCTSKILMQGLLLTEQPKLWLMQAWPADKNALMIREMHSHFSDLFITC